MKAAKDNRYVPTFQQNFICISKWWAIYVASGPVCELVYSLPHLEVVAQQIEMH